jgi:hypothetical protein
MKSKVNKLLFSIVIFMGACSNHATNSLTKEKTETQSKCYFAIESWIRNHALYPDSYKPLKYESIMQIRTYQNSIEIIPLRKYRVEHTFELNDTSQRVLLATMDFELQPDFFIDHIHYKTKDLISLQTRQYPPLYDDWLLQFGKPLTSLDSIEWQLNNRQLLFNLSVQFKENRLNSKLADSLVLEINKGYVN